MKKVKASIIDFNQKKEQQILEDIAMRPEDLKDVEELKMRKSKKSDL